MMIALVIGFFAGSGLTVAVIGQLLKRVVL